MTKEKEKEMSDEALKILCNLTLELTKLRQSRCEHLSIGDFAPEVLNNLIYVYEKGGITRFVECAFRPEHHLESGGFKVGETIPIGTCISMGDDGLYKKSTVGDKKEFIAGENLTGDRVRLGEDGLLYNW